MKTEFTFAGFTFPRYLAVVAFGKPAMLKKREQRKYTGGYYHAPKPNTGGVGFYLGSDAPFTLRIQETDASFSWGEFSGDCYTGIVARLNHNRGFLAGASMGTNMASFLDPEIYADESDAIRAANDAASRAADAQGQYEYEQSLECTC